MLALILTQYSWHIYMKTIRETTNNIIASNETPKQIRTTTFNILDLHEVLVRDGQLKKPKSISRAFF